MDYNKLNTLCKWEREKALYLVSCADDLEMDISGFGEIGLNTNSGNVYLWLEDYSFTLYMPISCELQKSDVMVLHTNTDNGNEISKQLTDFSNLSEIENWCESLSAEIA